MAEPLKKLFNEQFVIPFSEVCSIHISGFNQKKFTAFIFDKNWEHLELKSRIKHIAHALHKQLSDSRPNNLKIITAIADDIRIHQNKQDTFEYLVLCDYIEIYGQDYFYESLDAIEHVTILASCEFAIRPFLIKHPKETFMRLEKWSQHEHASVRRLASEGCRPRLPWGIGLPFLKIDPSPIFTILENLKDDSSLFVRRSVANNINDISKDHPITTIKLLKKWHGFSEDRNWLVKHAARTLLKQGNSEILKLFGYGDIQHFDISPLILPNKIITIGNYLNFDFSITNISSKQQKIRIEYFIHFMLNNGKLSKKVFKISERTMAPKEKLNYNRRHSFKLISTRKYYCGMHEVSLVINGIEQDTSQFTLEK